MVTCEVGPKMSTSGHDYNRDRRDHLSVPSDGVVELPDGTVRYRHVGDF